MPTPTYRTKWPNRSIFRSLKSWKCILLGGYIFHFWWKNDLNPSIYVAFHAEFESGVQIDPKPTQNPIFDQIMKIIKIIKNVEIYKNGREISSSDFELISQKSK